VILEGEDGELHDDADWEFPAEDCQLCGACTLEWSDCALIGCPHSSDAALKEKSDEA